MAHTPPFLTMDEVQYCDDSWDISFTVRGNIDAKSEEEAKEKAMRLILKTFPHNLYGIGIISAIPSRKL